MRVLAVDPGGTTGWASYASPVPVSSTTYASGRQARMDAEVAWGQLPDGLAGARPLWGILDSLTRPFSEGHTVLVIERYTIGGRTMKYSRQDDALRITGALEWAAADLGVSVVKQQPAEAMRLFTDERLRAFGWYARGEEHARDALRHLGFYLARKRLIRLTGGGDGGS